MKKYKNEKPQRKGIVIKIFTMKPKKPNSAIRKIAKVKVQDKILSAYIPGIGHNLALHSRVLIKGGKTQDLPGLKYKIIRGALDCTGVLNRKSSRSKYGSKKS